ncbi:MAG: hypothetical protein ACPGUC_05995 [Gammaproteobacteria bacterium]
MTRLTIVLVCLCVSGWVHAAETVSAAAAPSSDDIYFELPPDPRTIIDAVKQQHPDHRTLCAAGPGPITDAVVSTSDSLFQKGTITTHPWVAGMKVSPYFDAYCAELKSSD